MVSATSVATSTPTGTRVSAIEHPQRPYLRIPMGWEASPLRETQPRSRSLQLKVQPKRMVFTEHTIAVRNRRCGTHARCLRRNNPCQNVSLHDKNGSAGEPNALRPQPEAHATHFCQANNVLQVAPTGGPHNDALVPNLEKATKLLRITSALLQSLNGRRSRQRRNNDYTRGELVALIDWLVVLTGRSRHKVREYTPEARRIRASKLANER